MKFPRERKRRQYRLSGEDGDELGGGDSLGHGMRICSSDGEFSDGDFSDVREGGGFWEILEIEFERFFEIGEGFLLSGTEAGHVVVEALGDVVGIFAVEGVMEGSHGSKSKVEVLDGIAYVAAAVVTVSLSAWWMKSAIPAPRR